MLRGVVFDFNGVLVDDEPIHFRLFRQVLGEEGVELDEEAYYERYVGYDDRDGFATMLADAGRAADEPLLARLIARKASYYRDLVRREGYPYFPGALDLVRSVAERGWLLAVVSGALRGEVEGALEQEGIAGAFKAIVAAEDVERGKPDPEGYRRALEAFNSLPPLPERLVHPHELLAIEDSLAGLESARGAGLATLAVAHTHPAAELEGAGDAVVDGLEGLTAEGLAALVGRE